MNTFTFLTGGSRGLGLALVEQLQREGQPWVEFSRAAPHAHSVRADLADPLGFRTTVEHTVQRLQDQGQLQGRRLVVIHNAGVVTPLGAAGRQEATAVLANAQANFSGPLLGLSALLAALQDHPGSKRLLNISSGAALRPIAGWSLYCAAKAGLEHFIRTVDAEQRHQRHPWVAVNVNPGVMDTAMQADLRAAGPEAFPDHAVFVQRHASGELQDPARVAARVLALARRADLVGGERYDASRD